MKIKVKNRSMHDMTHMNSYLQSFLPYAQKRMGFNRPPTIFFDSDPQNAKNVLGKTGYYNPETDEIVVFVDKRHPKDILRSLSHELVHHAQNCRGDLTPEVAGETTPGYAQTNSHMRDMESEAYEFGSGLYFRDWEDSLKNQLEETNYKHITGDIKKMATYKQLKEEITAKVVAALTEKIKTNVEEAAKPDFLDLDGDGDKKEPMEKAAKEKDLKKEGDAYAPSHYCVHHGGVKHEGKIHMAEAVGHNWSEDSQSVTHYDMKLEDGPVIENVAFEDIQVTNASLAEAHSHSMKRDDKDDEELKERKKRDTPRDSDRREPEKLKVNEDVEDLDESDENIEETQEQEVVEESISNDEWYQNNLFEKLKKQWTK